MSAWIFVVTAPLESVKVPCAGGRALHHKHVDPSWPRRDNRTAAGTRRVPPLLGGALLGGVIYDVAFSRSPTLRFRTALPTSTTSPMNSCPRMSPFSIVGM